MSKQKYLVMNIASCFDCNDCFMSCKDEHVGNDWMPYTESQPRHESRWLKLLRTERGQCPRIDVGYLALMCQHCENAPCQNAFPDCIYRREDGIVLIDPEKARGMKEVVDSCPYGAIYWNEEKNVAQKCTMCAHIIDSGVQPCKPRCSHSCPTDSIEYYDIEPEEMAKIVEEQGLEVYRPELGTNPHVYYKNLYRFTKAFITGAVVDTETDDDVENVSITLKGNGVEETQITDYFGEFKFDKLLPGTYTLEIDGKTVKTVELDKAVNIGEIFI
ncbi:MAG: carboxypeptidase regulatory-like domain-containing protein [Clostridiales bacterium]|nr:carboxypeptidase regulatory-like domain-containing protein [Clostridiales bacterium]